MSASTRVVAVIQIALISPAALFLTAVLVAAGDQPPRYDLARFAQSLIDWYSVRAWTLFLLLLTMPLACLITGSITLLKSAGRSLVGLTTPIATLLVGWATITSAGVLGVAALHMLAN
jgi:hypothetical protein